MVYYNVYNNVFHYYNFNYMTWILQYINNNVL